MKTLRKNRGSFQVFISFFQIPKNAAKLFEEMSLSRKRMVQWQKEQEAKDAEVRRPPRKETLVKQYPKELLLRGTMYPVKEEQRELIYSGLI